MSKSPLELCLALRGTPVLTGNPAKAVRIILKPSRKEDSTVSAPAQSEKARRRSWYDYWAGIASLCLFTILTAVAAPQEPLTSYSLLVGVSPDRTNSVQLQGS